MKKLFLILFILATAIPGWAVGPTPFQDIILRDRTASNLVGLDANKETADGGSGTTGLIPNWTASAVLGDSTAYRISIANDTSTGTTANKLVKLVAGKGRVASVSETAGIIGIAYSGAGTSGNAVVTLLGVADCVFENATTQGNYVGIGTSNAGECRDLGTTTFPTDGTRVVGVSNATGAAGTRQLFLATPDVASAGSSPGSGTIDGTGTAGRLAKFSDSDTIADSLLNETGGNVVLTSGELRLPAAGLAPYEPILFTDPTTGGIERDTDGSGNGFTYTISGNLRALNMYGDPIQTMLFQSTNSARYSLLQFWNDGNDGMSFYSTGSAYTGSAAWNNLTNTSILDSAGTAAFNLGTSTAQPVRFFAGGTNATTNKFLELDGTNVIFTPQSTGTVDVRGNSTQAGQFRLYEDSDDGSNYASFKVPTLAGDTAYTLPPDDGDAGEQLTTDGSGVLTWEAAGSGGGGASLPVTDTTSLVEGSGDNTKEIRFEVDGLTTATTRVLTPPDANIVIAGSASALTSGRIPVVTTSGLLTDTANLTWDNTNFRLRGQNLTTAADNATTMVQLSGTMPTTPSTGVQGVLISITGAGSTSQSPVASQVNFNAGYTGSSYNAAFLGFNANAGTGTTHGLNTTGFSLNAGFAGLMSASTSGINAGGTAEARSSTATNAGLIGKAASTVAGTNIGVLGNAANSTEATDLKNIGGYFTLDNTLITGANISVALLAQGDGTDDIFRGYDDTTLMFRMEDTGEFTSAGTSTLGWAVVDGTDNQACTTTCTFAAVYGIDLAAGATAPVIVDATSATADVCLCAGAN